MQKLVDLLALGLAYDVSQLGFSPLHLMRAQELCLLVTYDELGTCQWSVAVLLGRTII